MSLCISNRESPPRRVLLEPSSWFMKRLTKLFSLARHGYNTGQRRGRAPNVAYDNPGTAADGLRTADQLDLFNGSPDRYEWKLLGKKEMWFHTIPTSCIATN